MLNDCAMKKGDNRIQTWCKWFFEKTEEACRKLMVMKEVAAGSICQMLEVMK